MPALVDCCRAYATVGEMAGVFRDVLANGMSLAYSNSRIHGDF